MEGMAVRFERYGFAILPAVVDGTTLEAFRAEADRLLGTSEERGGVRDALRRSSVLRSSEVASKIATALLGPAARVTKLTVFDKTPRANWKVPFHQDLTIAVADRREVEGFGPWSVKDGVVHVQPPVAVLQRIVAVRIHLDATPAENGALRVLAGTHRMGRLTREQISELRGQVPETVCPVEEGGAMVLSPLLVHASSPAASPRRRRVLHFELCSIPLPGGLAWV
jgi:ectoine hydroxylase-related dioxygenase (phytanoyl-CoA dioxygenase family)